MQRRFAPPPACGARARACTRVALARGWRSAGRVSVISGAFQKTTMAHDDRRAWKPLLPAQMWTLKSQLSEVPLQIGRSGDAGSDRTRHCRFHRGHRIGREAGTPRRRALFAEFTWKDLALAPRPPCAHGFLVADDRRPRFLGPASANALLAVGLPTAWPLRRAAASANPCGRGRGRSRAMKSGVARAAHEQMGVLPGHCDVELLERIAPGWSGWAGASGRHAATDAAGHSRPQFVATAAVTPRVGSPKPSVTGCIGSVSSALCGRAIREG